jgi:hypothetical protein
MIQKTDTPVLVIFGLGVLSLEYAGREYKIEKLGLHHTYRFGRTLYHVFSVTGGGLFFRLVLNTDNLLWRLTEVSDGESN